MSASVRGRDRSRSPHRAGAAQPAVCQKVGDSSVTDSSGATCTTGVAVVDFAAALLDKEAYQHFDRIPRDELPTYTPVHADCPPAGRSAVDSIPWVHRDHSAPTKARAGVIPRAKCGIECALSPPAHIRRHWNVEAGEPSASQPEAPQVDIPPGVRNALDWMRQCDDFERWAVSQVRRWQRVAAYLEPA